MMKDTAWIVSIDNPERVSSYRYNAIIPATELSGQVLRFGPTALNIITVIYIYRAEQMRDVFAEFPKRAQEEEKG